MKNHRVKIHWPNKLETYVEPGENWLSLASNSGYKIPTGCLNGSCGACEISINGETIRACISRVESNDQEIIVEQFYDPYW
tara:strand:+ start:9265 stop:9507 length:243 start_codon:yes stop_codon:yes gene_type:complete